jgi:hypothetical protein
MGDANTSCSDGGGRLDALNGCDGELGWAPRRWDGRRRWMQAVIATGASGCWTEKRDGRDFD